MKRILAVCSLILLGCLCVHTDSQAKIVVKNAKAGPHSTWSLDDKGTLTVKGKGKVKNVEFPSELFRYSVKKIVVTEGITAIGEDIFRGCRSAEKIVLPDTLQTLERCCFRRFKRLKSIRIPKKVTLLPYAAFQDCTALQSMELPDGLKTMYADAFDGCSSLEKVVVPDSVTHMDRHVFRNCPKLKTIVLPKDLKKANLSFDRCFALRKIQNRSSLPIKLNTASGHRVWRVNGKKMTVLKPGKTAKTRGTKYRISYDLREGEALGQLPETRYYGEEAELPRAVREGDEFIGWRSPKEWGFGEEFLTLYEGDITLVARFVSLKIESLPGGIIKVQADGDDIIWDEKWGAGIYWYIFRFRPVGGGETWYSARLWGDWVDVLDRMEKGKEYICDISYGYGEAFEDVDEHEAWFLPRRIYVQP